MVETPKNQITWGRNKIFDANGGGIHSVISPNNFGEKSGFSKGLCLGGKSLFKVPGEKGFLEGI